MALMAPSVADQTGTLVFLTVVDTIGSLLKLANVVDAGRQKRPFLSLLLMTMLRWNSGRAVGPRTAFRQDEVTLLIAKLTAQSAAHDLALLTAGVDTMLRGSDLLSLKVRDIAFADGSIRRALIWRQQKTSSNVTPTLTETSQSFLAQWIISSRKSENDFVFTATKPKTALPITASTYRRKVKAWAQMINLDPTDYSSHSAANAIEIQIKDIPPPNKVREGFQLIPTERRLKLSRFTIYSEVVSSYSVSLKKLTKIYILYFDIRFFTKQKVQVYLIKLQ